MTGSLTQLRITPEQEEDEDPPPGGTDVLARAVNRLTSLKCLQLGRYCCSREVLLALRELTCLTQLKLCDRYTSVRDVSSRQLGLGGWGDGNFLGSAIDCCRTFGATVAGTRMQLQVACSMSCRQPCNHLPLHGMRLSPTGYAQPLTCLLPPIPSDSIALMTDMPNSSFSSSNHILG